MHGCGVEIGLDVQTMAEWWKFAEYYRIVDQIQGLFVKLEYALLYVSGNWLLVSAP